MKETKVVIINGYATSGKDTFVKLCQEFNRDVVNFSTIDYVKDFARMYLGWDRGDKSPKARRMLSDVKDMLTRWNNMPNISVDKFIKHNEGKICFIHAREPENIEELKNKYNAVTLLVTTNRPLEEQDNHADNNVGNYKYEYVIKNNGDLANLKCQAWVFMGYIGQD